MDFPENHNVHFHYDSLENPCLLLSHGQNFFKHI